MGAIINIFKNIIGLITGLFGGKKGKDGFFLEAPATENAPAVKASAPAAATTAATTAAPAQNAPAKKGKGKGKAAAVAATAVATVVAAPVARDAADIINAALSAPKSTAQQAMEGSSISFAEMNAVPMSSATRRRPGANMTGFLDMAKTVKTSR